MSAIELADNSEVETSTFFRPAVGIAFTCATLAALAFTSSEVARPVAGTMSMALHGQQPLKSGCATFYGSKPSEYPDTLAHTVCSDAAINKFTITQIGFGSQSENYGISYVEVGYAAWVSLYEFEDFTGETAILAPLTQTWLWETKMKNGNPWNDHVKSIEVEHRSSTGVFLVKGNQEPGEDCAILYASNPYWVPYTTGVQICAAKDLDKSPTFSYDDIEGEGYKLENYGKGVSYIKAGKNVHVIANSGKNFDGEYSVKVEKNTGKELSNIEMKPNAMWGDHVKSVKLLFF